MEDSNNIESPFQTTLGPITCLTSCLIHVDTESPRKRLKRTEA